MRANPVRENQNDKRTEFWLTIGIKDFEAKKEGEGQKKKKKFMASWSSGNAFVSGAGGLRFKSRANQIERSVTNGSLRCDISSKEAMLPGRNDTVMGAANSLHASA